MTENTPQKDRSDAAPGPESAAARTADPGPGALLLTAREHLGVSTQEVADELKLPTHVIEALEKDDYSRLPPGVFSRGYLRSYARLLDLDPEALLKLYPSLSQEPEPSTQVPVVPLRQRLDLVQIAAIVGAVLVAVLVVLSLLFGGEEDGEPAGEATQQNGARPAVVAPARAAPTPTPSSATPSSATPSSATPARGIDPGARIRKEQAVEIEPVADSAEDEIRVDVEDDVPREPVPVDRTTRAPAVSVPVSEELPVSGGAVEVSGPAVVDEIAGQSAGASAPLSSAARRITAAGDDRLTFSFSADCWVEVRSLDGESLYSDLSRSGRRLELVGQGPFRVRLGYAPGAELLYNGDRVPLEGRTRNNVANLVLGR